MTQFPIFLSAVWFEFIFGDENSLKSFDAKSHSIYSIQ